MDGAPIAIIGATGQLARALLRVGAECGVPLAAAGRPDADLAEPRSVRAFLERTAPRVVINAAAYTAVDKAETDSDAAFEVNATGPGMLAVWCAERGVPLIHMSTDYVFDGTKRTPYVEGDVCNPLGVYGRSKLVGEEAVRAALDGHIIVRTAWVYGPDGNNFLKTMLRVGAERDVVRVVADQTGTPTAAADIAAALMAIASTVCRADGPPVWGTYHLVAGGTTTWHGFAAEIFATAAALGFKTPRLEAITTADYPTPAVRPAYGVLDTSKLRQTFGIELPAWQQSTTDCIRQMAKTEAANKGNP